MSRIFAAEKTIMISSPAVPTPSVDGPYGIAAADRDQQSDQ